MVECQLPKLDVAGSTPVSRSNFPQNQSLIILRESVFFVRRAEHSQNVAIAKVISTTIAVVSIV